MRANKTYEFRVNFISKDKETLKANAKRLFDINCKNKNLFRKYDKLLTETRNKIILQNARINPMSPVVYDIFTIAVEGHQSRIMYNVKEDGEYYVISFLHYIEDPVDNGRYLSGLNCYVEALENLYIISDDDFLRYVENKIKFL